MLILTTDGPINAYTGSREYPMFNDSPVIAQLFDGSEVTYITEDKMAHCGDLLISGAGKTKIKKVFKGMGTCFVQLYGTKEQILAATPLRNTRFKYVSLSENTITFVPGNSWTIPNLGTYTFDPRSSFFDGNTAELQFLGSVDGFLNTIKLMLHSPDSLYIEPTKFNLKNPKIYSCGSITVAFVHDTIYWFDRITGINKFPAEFTRCRVSYTNDCIVADSEGKYITIWSSGYATIDSNPLF